MVAPKSSIAYTQTSVTMNPYNVTNERPADTAVNIQHGHPSSKPSVRGPRSPSPSPEPADSSPCLKRITWRE